MTTDGSIGRFGRSGVWTRLVAMSRPDDILGCVPIREHCGECDQRPVAIASLPVPDSAELDLAWACDDHIAQLVQFIEGKGLDPTKHLFEVSRTCRATETGEAPCGAAGDYLVVCEGGKAVITVCERHMRAWEA